MIDPGDSDFFLDKNVERFEYEAEKCPSIRSMKIVRLKRKIVNEQLLVKKLLPLLRERQSRTRILGNLKSGIVYRVLLVCCVFPRDYEVLDKRGFFTEQSRSSTWFEREHLVGSIDSGWNRIRTIQRIESASDDSE